MKKIAFLIINLSAGSLIQSQDFRTRAFESLQACKTAASKSIQNHPYITGLSTAAVMIFASMCSNNYAKSLKEPVVTNLDITYRPRKGTETKYVIASIFGVFGKCIDGIGKYIEERCLRDFTSNPDDY